MPLDPTSLGKHASGAPFLVICHTTHDFVIQMHPDDLYHCIYIIPMVLTQHTDSFMWESPSRPVNLQVVTKTLTIAFFEVNPTTVLPTNHNYYFSCILVLWEDHSFMYQ